MSPSQFVAGIAEGVWISGMIALFLGSGVRALGRVGPSLRMRVWVLGFLAALTLPAAFALSGPFERSWLQRLAGQASVDRVSAAAGTTIRVPHARVAASASALTGERLSPAGAETFEPRLQPVLPLTDVDPATSAVVRGPIVPAGSWSTIVLIVLAGVALARLCRIALGLRRMAVQKLEARPLPERGVEWRSALRAAGTRRSALLLESARVGAPVQVGYVRPAVLVPPGLFDRLTVADCRHVLLHEAVHIARRDDWTLLLQRIAEAIFWFHPAVWWLAARIDLERETICDGIVARRSGSREYARTLVRLAELHGSGAPSRLAPALAPRTTRLAQRVDQLLGRLPHRRPAMRVASGAALPCVALLALSISPIRIATPAKSTPTLLPRSDATGIVHAGIGARLDSLLSAYERAGFSGTVLLARHGTIVLDKGYGLADRERRIRASAGTRYGLAGFTKAFTAAAVLRLVEQGRLFLHEPIGLHLPELTGSKREVTIQQLLTHTDGLARLAAPIFRTDTRAFLRALDSTPAQFPPGQGYRYNDFGHSVLAIIIARVTGQSFESYVRSSFIEPLGLSIGFEPDGDALAIEYRGSKDALTPIPMRAYAWGRRGSLGMTGTARDAYRWLLALDSSAVISPAMRRQLLSPQNDTDYGSRQTYGWELYSPATGAGPLLRRVAGTPGMEGEILHDPAGAWSAVILTNSRLGWRFRVWSDIARLAAE